MAIDLSICNPRPRQLPGPQLLHQLVPEHGPGSDPAASAIEYTDAEGSTICLSYSELQHQAEALAARIQETQRRCASPSDRFIIPLLLPQCPELYIAQLACLKAGGAFCPIVLDAPEERLRFILRDIDARILLTTTSIKQQLPHFDDVFILAADDDDTTDDTIFNAPSISPNDPAYIMYTSGSTGQPKGVVLPHSAATQALLAHDRHIPKFSRFLQFASPTFDVSVFEIFFPWFRHVTLVSCDRRRLLNDLPAAINELNVDACELTPSVASSLLHGRESVPSLKLLLTIGEMLKPSVIQDFGGNVDEPAILHGMYGPTEATIHCTFQTNFAKDMSARVIGVPLDTVSAFIVEAVATNDGLTPALNILPKGEEGELAVGGHQLADGYLNREEQTRAAFVEHPQYGVLYRTGDRAKMLRDGSLECFGRISSGQAKLRGQRIELGEVEYAVSRTPGCRDVVAEIISGILVVFCMSKSGKLPRSAVFDSCRNWLPAFMVPGDVVILQELPYLASGKCDRKALRSQYEASQQATDGNHGAASEDESKVSRTISQVLGVKVHRDSILPALGLDSLSAIRIASELRKAGFLQLDAAQILGARTPGQIDAALDKEGGPGVENMVSQAEEQYRTTLDQAIRHVVLSTRLCEIESSFPCTAVQSAMLADTAKDSRSYCNWVEFWLPGITDFTTLSQQLIRLAKVHAMLRSGFVAVTGLPWSYATVMWKSLSSSQIVPTNHLNYEFEAQAERDMLHPCEFQLMETETGSRLLIKIHHALYDQWAMDILQADLATLLQGKTCQASGSFKSIADYNINYANEAMSSNTIEFWQEQLRDVKPTLVPLLRDNSTKVAPKRTGWRDLSASTEFVRSKASDIGCSSPAIFQTVVAFILGQYCGSLDVTLGSVFSGRTLPIDGIDRIFGPCLATLPLRIDFSTAGSCGELLGAVTDRNRAMQNHITTSPTAIREAAGVAPGVKLFDCLFVWQQSTVDRSKCSDTVQLVDSEDQLDFNLVLEFEPSLTAIRVRATYQQSLISAALVDILLRQIDCITKALLEDPELDARSLGSTLTEDLLSISNPDPIDHATTHDLASVIHDRALTTPSKTAIVFADSLEPDSPKLSSITYGELDRKANHMAHVLIASGLKTQDLVCICMEKCIDLYAMMLATFKAGAGYLPLVPDTPPVRIRSVLSQANVRLCICDSGSLPTMRGLTDAMILDVSSIGPVPPSVDTPNVAQIGSRIAYAVYTSGSTGEPKGVAVTMDNLQGNLAVLSELYNVSAEDNLLQACSQAFDVSAFEIFFAFYTGICLCSATKEVMFRDFEHSIRTLGVTHLSLTPTVAALVEPDNVPNVRFLVTAGEAVTEKVHRRWAGRGLHQGYGPSETTNICTVRMNTAQEDVLGSIGPPFRNTSAFVIGPQDDFQILPTGSYGEYAFGGEQVFRGYIGRDDLNSTKIIQHPRYGRIYRSGDMGRILPDGSLLIAGRLDDQVKIRGNRVELNEINAVISDHSQVSDCATILMGESSAEQSLVTFWVSRAGQAHSDAPVSVTHSESALVPDLFDRLEEALPSYMVPTFLVPLNRLPMTTQGKLDKRKLQAVFGQIESHERNSFSHGHEADSEDSPFDPVERIIAETIAEMLHISLDDISRHSSFLALGLNSLNAIQLAKLLEQKVEIRVSVAGVLRHPTPARLCKSLSFGSTREDNSSEEDDLIPHDLAEEVIASFTQHDLAVETVLPCTPLQEAMLSASSSNGSDSYSSTTKLEFSGDINRLRECWSKMEERHEILRTSFATTSRSMNPFVQVVLRDPRGLWHHTGNSALVNGTASKTLNGNGHGHANGAIDRKPVSSASPVRVVVRGKDIYLQMHHAVYDGIAMHNLFREITSLYQGQDLPPSVSFEPFLRELNSHNGQEATQFWKKRMNGFHSHPLPKTNETTDTKEELLERTISIQLAHVKSFSERHSCTNLALFQAAWVKTLSCAQDIQDLCFGNVVSGRAVPVDNIDKLVAPCFNTLPVRVELDGLRTNLDLIRRLHQNNLDVLPFQLTAARRIQSVSQQPSQHLFDSLLLVQPPQDEMDLWGTEENTMSMGIPIVLEITPEESSYDLQLHYLTENVDGSMAEALADAFAASLESCIKYPSSRISNFAGFDSARIARQLLPPAPAQDDILGETSASENEDWSADESTIRDILADLAGVEKTKISKHTSLYQIGLDSLNAVQVASKLRKLGLHADTADVMQYQTPAALASFLKTTEQQNLTEAHPTLDLQAFERNHKSSISESLGISGHDVERVRPCTPAQSGMLAQFIQSLGSYYVGHVSFAVPDQCTDADIKHAWTLVQKKHQVLRMGFHQTDDASIPFAMLIYRPGTFFDQVIKRMSSQNGTSVRDYNTQDIFNSLHLPSWRLSVQSTSGERRMHLSLHHALYDASSLQILLQDFGRALQSQDLGRSLSIDNVLRHQLEGSNTQPKNHEDFWSSALSSARLLKFPNLTPTTVPTSQTKSTRLSSKADLTALDSFCAKEGVTIQALGQSIWAMLLAAYVGEPDVTFGTVISGFSAMSEPVAFPTISVVPVYCNTGKAVAAEVIKDMVTFNASAQRHRFPSLSDIQRYAGSSGQALFDTLFVYQKAQDDNDVAFDWRTVDDSLGNDYIVSMELEAPTKGKVGLRLTYDTQVVPDAHATLLLQQYDMMMNQLLADEDLSCFKDLTLMSHTPPKEAELPCSVSLLHQFVELGARMNPQLPALEFISSMDGKKGRTIWTYDELDRRSNQVAHLIQQHGVQPGSKVAVCMNKSPEASFAFVGILKAACAFLAMDPDLPLARRKFIIEDSGAQLLFTDHGLSDPDLAQVVHTIGLKENMLIQLPVTSVDIPPIDPSFTSYCLYTSGTTGTPKGCELSHENAVQAMMAFQTLFKGHWTDSSRWLQFASYWFDVSVLEQFWSWSVGVTVVGAPRDLVLEDLPGFIRNANITHIDLTPSLARLIKPEDVPSLWNHVFITGGEALKQEIINAWGPYKTICNGYGPTEATIGVTMNPFIGSEAKPSNIGPAFDNVGAYVFKPNTDELVMRGAVGELCVSGKLVGKGYLNRPDLAEKAFPYVERYNERVYRTGDLVRLLADGSVSFIGRADTQAKLRGQRLEIDEIDSVIKFSTSEINDVASLVTKPDGNVKEMLISFVVSPESESGDLEMLSPAQSRQLVRTALEACQNHLPGYMVPTHVIPVSRLPLTVNNKVDTKSLMALFTSLSTKQLQELKSHDSNDRPLLPNEAKIAKILGRLLSIDCDDMTPVSNVFAFGLSSVSAINFSSMLKRAGLDGATVAVVMQNPTLERLAKVLTGTHNGASEYQGAVKQAKLSMTAFTHRYRSLVAQRLDVSISDIEALAPCSPLQEGLLTESFKGEHRPYFNHFWYDISYLDIGRVESTVQELHRLVPMFRTVFLQTDAGFIQTCHLAPACPLKSVRHESGRWDHQLLEQKQHWLAQQDQEVIRPFEVVVLRAKHGKIMLAFHVHHALYDGVSWDLTMDLLTALYKSRSKGAEDTGPSFFDALPYGPLCTVPGQEAFWKDHLRSHHFIPLPTLSEYPARSNVSLRTQLSNAPAIENVRKKLGTSHQTVLQAAFAVALHQLSPDTQSFGVVLSGRSIAFEGADKVIGPMFNTVPTAIGLGTTDTWKQHLTRTQQGAANVLPYQHTPLRDIRKYCGFLPSDPVFDVLFVFQRPQRSVSSKGLKGGSGFVPLDTDIPAEYPLAFEVEMGDSGDITVSVVAQRAYANESTLRDLVSNFEAAVRNMEEEVEGRIATNFTISTSTQKPAVKSQFGDREARSEINGVSGFTWTQEAKTLRLAIAQLAGCDEGSVDERSSIFNLGLDSIDAVKLASRLKRAGLSIPVSKILEAQTIPRLLEAVQGDRKLSPEPAVGGKLALLKQQLKALSNSLEGLSAEIVEDVLPATPSQEALIADMLRSEFHDYYNSDILRIQEDVDVDQLKSAWQQVVDASPILRTSFVEVSDPSVDAVFAQVVHRETPLHFEQVSVTDLDELSGYMRDIREDVSTTFSSKSPLRLAIATIHPERYLVLSLAHAQYDGHSLALMHEDVSAAYHNGLQQRPLYDSVLEEALNATSLQAQHFWRSTLTGATVSHFTTQSCDASTMTHRTERTTSITAQEARSICKKHGVSMQAFAEAAWALVLAHYVQELEVIFGVVLACRDSEDMEAIMFPTMNTVPVRVNIHGSACDTLTYVQGIIDELRPYHRTPLRFIQAACSGVTQSTDSSHHSALFDTLFTYQHRPAANGNHSNPLYESVDGNSNVEYPIAVEVEAVGDGLVLRVAAKDNALDEMGTKELLKRFDHVLNFFANSPDKPVVDFSGNKVSVCGLPSFTVEDEDTSMSVSSTTTVYENEGGEDTELASTSTIRSVLAQVSKVSEEDVGSNSTIESLGIVSISAIKVSALLRKEAIKLSVSEILKAQTLRHMAELVENKSSSPTPTGVSAKEVIKSALQQVDVYQILDQHSVNSANVENVLPATAGQQYMVAMWQRSHGELFYPTFNYKLNTSKPIDSIKAAWDQLVQRHSILRTIFLAGRDKVPLLQAMLKSVPESFFTNHNSIQQQSRNGQPLVRMTASKHANGYDLALTIHHALYDAVSLPLLVEELQSNLANSAPMVQKVDLTQYIALAVAPESQQARRSFWTKYLQNIQLRHLRRAETGKTGKVKIFKPAAFSSCAQLEQLARQAQVSVQALLFAAYAKLYARHAMIEDGREDVVFGIYIANRSHLPDLDCLASPTLNLLPLLVRSPDDRDLITLAKEISADLRSIGTSANSMASLAEIADWTGVKVDSFVNFLKVPDQEERVQDEGEDRIVEDNDEWNEERNLRQERNTVERLTMPSELTDFRAGDAYQHAVDVELSVINGSLNIGLFCLEQFFDIEEAQGIVAEFGTELQSLVD